VDLQLLLRARRWLLFNFRCLRGRRCADVVVDAISAPGDPVLHIEYECGGCGTTYRYDSLRRVRTRWLGASQ
jgi:hypothetical protein